MKKFLRYFFVDHFFATLWSVIGIVVIIEGYLLIRDLSREIASRPVKVVFRAVGESDWFTIRTDGSADFVREDDGGKK
ncbi:MAG: hypothetical protein MJ016_01500 [Victivallaceae bacterium]|nr:hypothetical protein [Victivallaceae bacterium]